ncbi:MAG: GNAT family N-acetyltransferase [Acholeplasmataceae bacterium]|nr:GNAT family N-acetyltransferase [Acholeplasmataceae bacterium]
MRPIKTKRLLLRKIDREDVKDMFEYAVDPEVGPKAGWLPHKSIEETKRVIEGMIISNEVYSIVYRDKMIGTIGVHTKNDKKYLGYVLNRNYWRQGIMTEACKAVITYLFRELNIDVLYISHFIDNYKSEGLIKKLDFELVGPKTDIVNGEPKQVLEYKIERYRFERKMLTWQ